MNVSATLKVFSLLRNPSLCLPHATVPTFDRVPISVATALTAANGGQTPDIRAVVLDKDNCFAKPTENSIYGPYKVRQPTFNCNPAQCKLLWDLAPDLSPISKRKGDQAF